MPENPWAQLQPGAHGQLTAIRSDAQSATSSFWAKRADGRLAFLFDLSACAGLEPVLPTLRGIDVVWVAARGELVLVLADQEDWEIFAQLCQDLSKNCSGVTKHHDCFSIIFLRLAQWQRLLMHAKPRILEEHEIRGLFAELSFLELLNSQIGASALETWMGPEGAPQDFSVGKSLFEIKAHLSGSSQKVFISSPEQLHSPRGAPLFLVVGTLLFAKGSNKSLSALVNRLSSSFESVQADQFWGKLGKAGYLPLEDYEHRCYDVSSFSAYCVEGDFPRIVPGEVPNGLSEVKYCLAISACAPYARSSVLNEIKRAIT
jgi:hypothetical protein